MAQSYQVNLSPGHQKKLSEIKNLKKKLKRYQKFSAKDSLGQFSSDKIDYSDKLDSLSEYMTKRDELNQELRQIQKEMNLDSGQLTYEELKSTALSSEEYKNELSRLEQMEGDYQKYIFDKDSIRSLHQNRDSFLSEGKVFLAEGMGQYGTDYAHELLTEEQSTLLDDYDQEYTVESYFGENEPYQKYGEELTELNFVTKDSLGHYLKKKGSQVYNSQDKMIAEAQKKLKNEKIKYSKITNSNDMESSVKKKSLEGTRLFERFSFGGNFNINSTEPVIFDINPQLGYHFNRDWLLGLGFNYRDAIGEVEKQSQIVSYGYGFSLFTSHMIYKNLFGYAEYSLLKDDPLIGEAETNGHWIPKYLVGLGLEIRLHHYLDGQVMLLYDVTHQSEGNLYAGPFVVKFGFSLSEIGSKKVGKTNKK